MMFDEIRLGIATPKDEPKNVDEMRQAIDRAGRGSSLTTRQTCSG